MHFLRIISLVIFLLVCHVNWSCCVTLELFSERDYKGFLDKRVVTHEDEKKCIKLHKLHLVRSLKTDKCVMLYENEDCSRFDITKEPDQFSKYSIRVENNTNHFPEGNKTYWGRYDERGVGSFHVCSNDLGGSEKLNVDLYSDMCYTGDLVKTWTGVCNCENVPDVELEKHEYISVDNHGNSMNIYLEENCRGTPQFIPAGDNMRSRAIYFENGVSILMKSFRPGDNVDCIELDASIYKFTFYNGSLAGGGDEEDVKMAATQTLINDGALPMTQAIEFSKTVSNNIEYSVAHAFTQVHSAGAKLGVATETTGGVPFVFGAKLKLSLEANYQYTNTHGETGTNKTSHTESETVKVTTTVQVAACEKCHVTGLVKTVQDFAINYTAHALVKGKDDDKKLTAEEIRAKLPAGMEYVKDYDQYNVEATAVGSMRADFAWRTFVSKTCEPLINCSHGKSRPGGKTHEIYEVPFVVVANEKVDSVVGEYEIGEPMCSPGEFRESALSESTLF